MRTNIPVNGSWWKIDLHKIQVFDIMRDKLSPFHWKMVLFEGSWVIPFSGLDSFLESSLAVIVSSVNATRSPFPITQAYANIHNHRKIKSIMIMKLNMCISMKSNLPLSYLSGLGKRDEAQYYHRSRWRYAHQISSIILVSSGSSSKPKLHQSRVKFLY